MTESTTQTPDFNACLLIREGSSVSDFIDPESVLFNLKHFDLMGYSESIVNAGQYKCKLEIYDDQKFEKPIICRKISKSKFGIIALNIDIPESILNIKSSILKIWECNDLGAVPIIILAFNKLADQKEKMISLKNKIERISDEFPITFASISPNDTQNMSLAIEDLVINFFVGPENYNLPDF